MFSRRVTRFIAGAAAAVVIAGGAHGIVSATATNSSAGATTTTSLSGLPGRGGSNARSGPAAGGASGTVASAPTSSFTLMTSAGQKVTIDEMSTTRYRKGKSSTSPSVIKEGEGVLVLGTTNGATITASQIIVQPTSAVSLK